MTIRDGGRQKVKDKKQVKGEPKGKGREQHDDKAVAI